MTDPDIGTFRQIAAGLYLEGLAIDYARQIVWYSDPIKGGVHGVTPEGKKIASFNEDRRWTGGLLVNEDGSVLSSGEGGIMWNNPETGRHGWLLEEIDGHSINGINEMIPDGSGGFYFGTSDLERIAVGGQTRPTALYRLTVDRTVMQVAGEIGFTNGLMYDSARKRLYCSDTFCCVWVFDVRNDFSLENKRVLLEKQDSDGMALDADGNLWITGFRSPFLERVSASGAVLPKIATPMGAVSQVRFGGQDMCDYFITVVPPDAGDTLKVGGQLTGEHSFVCRGRSDVPGMPLAPIRFALD